MNDAHTVTRSVRLRRHQYSGTVHTVTEMTVPEEIVDLMGIGDGQVVELVAGADGRMEIVIEEPHE